MAKIKCLPNFLFCTFCIFMFAVFPWIISYKNVYVQHQTFTQMFTRRKSMSEHTDIDPLFSFLHLPLYSNIIYAMNESSRRTDGLTWNKLDITQFNHTIEYCLGLGTGLGNILSHYWTARAIIFFSNSSFLFITKQNKICKKLSRNLKWFIDPKMNMFTFYLPLNTSKNMFNYYNFTYSHYHELLQWNKHCIFNFFNGYTYRNEIQLLHYNPIFLPIMINETHDALQKHMNVYNSSVIHMMDNVLDIVIHFRCGDIMGIKNPDYGLLTLQFYREAFELLNATSMHNVYFITQIGKKSLRTWTTTQEHKYGSKCKELVYKYTAHIRGLYNFSNFTIIGDSNINVDFYHIATAQNFIVSMSSFAQQAAFVNVNNVIFPNYGPWKNIAEKWVNGDIWVPTKHRYIDVVNPSKRYIMSNEYVEDKWSVGQIVDYLVSH